MIAIQLIVAAWRPAALLLSLWSVLSSRPDPLGGRHVSSWPLAREESFFQFFAFQPPPLPMGPILARQCTRAAHTLDCRRILDNNTNNHRARDPAES